MQILKCIFTVDLYTSINMVTIILTNSCLFNFCALIISYSSQRVIAYFYFFFLIFRGLWSIFLHYSSKVLFLFDFALFVFGLEIFHSPMGGHSMKTSRTSAVNSLIWRNAMEEILQMGFLSRNSWYSLVFDLFDVLLISKHARYQLVPCMMQETLLKNKWKDLLGKVKRTLQAEMQACIKINICHLWIRCSPAAFEIKAAAAAESVQITEVRFSAGGSNRTVRGQFCAAARRTSQSFKLYKSGLFSFFTTYLFCTGCRKSCILP